ncbi:F-box domain-containing protein [Mycena indigotica]|uniref:F-box domain-containing protein n=1 Tax=Mycena indigotica TaxID=2126181 RepID=A0A8H6VQA5_9AGAR|nr:F-box domain-containing protein [Mycena indigotica]KAF7289769.1 F-box domain-containing protein [Mycena indigotica]
MMLPPLPTILQLLRIHADPPADLGGPFSATDVAALSALGKGDRQLAYRIYADEAERNAAEEAQSQLRAQYRAYRALFAPVQKLPVEILQEIFRICARALLPIGYGSHMDVRHIIQQRPLRVLSHVCGFWRRIVYASPALWSTIGVSGWAVRAPDPAYPTRSLDAAKAYQRVLSSLEHAKTAPLDITIHRSTHRAIGLFATWVPEWRSVNMTFIQPEDLEYLATITGNRLDSLVTFRLASFLAPPSFPDNCLRFLVEAKSLRHLSLTGTFIGFVPAEVLRRLHSLKCRTNPETLDASVAVMSKIPSETSYDLAVYCGVGTGEHLPARLPETTSYILRFSLLAGNHNGPQATDAIKEIITTLTLPSVQYLQFGAAETSPHTAGHVWLGPDDENVDGPPQYTLPFPWLHDQVLAFFRRSSCNTHLTDLDLSAANIPLDDLKECLALLDVLETLAIAEHPTYPYPHRLITDAFFRALVVGPTPLVPRLSSISIHSILAFDDRALLAFLQSRVASPARADPNGPFHCHIYSLPGYWRRLGHVRAAAGVVDQIAILRKENGLRLSWTQLSGRDLREDVEEDEWNELDRFWSGPFELEG